MAPHEFDTGLRRAELDPHWPRPIDTPWGTMALFVLEGEVVCVQAFCPHLEGPLFQGSVAHGEVTCPWHGWRFDLRTGRRVDLLRPRSGPDARPLVRCEVTSGAGGTLVLRAPREAAHETHGPRSL